MSILFASNYATNIDTTSYGTPLDKIQVTTNYSQPLSDINKTQTGLTVTKQILVSSKVTGIISQTYSSTVTGSIKNNATVDFANVRLILDVQTKTTGQKGVLEIEIKNLLVGQTYTINQAFETKANYEQVNNISATQNNQTLEVDNSIANNNNNNQNNDNGKKGNNSGSIALTIIIIILVIAGVITIYILYKRYEKRRDAKQHEQFVRRQAEKYNRKLESIQNYSHSQRDSIRRKAEKYNKELLSLQQSISESQNIVINNTTTVLQNPIETTTKSKEKIICKYCESKNDIDQVNCTTCNAKL